jgi:hypothetical protein
MALSHMYRDADSEPACLAEQVREHNRLVAFYEEEDGLKKAQRAYEYWRGKFEASPSAHANRMRDIAAGVVGLSEPWMTKVGHLTIRDVVEMEHPDDPPEPIDWAEEARVLGIDRMNRALSDGQAHEAAELSMQQELETHGEPTPAQRERFSRQREELDAKFAEARVRYNAEYHAAEELGEQIREDEKRQSLEPDQEHEKGLSQ